MPCNGYIHGYTYTYTCIHIYGYELYILQMLSFVIFNSKRDVPVVHVGTAIMELVQMN